MNKKILISTLFALILLSGICVAIFYNISNRISDTLIDTIVLPGDDKNTPTTGESSSLPSGSAGTAGSPSQDEKNTGTTASSPTGQSQSSTDSLQLEREKIKESVPMSDKMFVTSKVLTKLSKSEISMLMGMLQGGLTEAEKQTAKQIAFSRFSSDEMNRIYQIYYKYANSVSVS